MMHAGIKNDFQLVAERFLRDHPVVVDEHGSIDLALPRALIDVLLDEDEAKKYFHWLDEQRFAIVTMLERLNCYGSNSSSSGTTT